VSADFEIVEESRFRFLTNLPADVDISPLRAAADIHEGTDGDDTADEGARGASTSVSMEPTPRQE
jgi:hypothetical protein